MKQTILLFVTLFAICVPGRAFGNSSFNADDVLAISAKIPATELGPRSPGHWDTTRDAREIAMAIAQVAPDLETAALMDVYAAFEGGMRRCPMGDSRSRGWGGYEALGAWQLHATPARIACDPYRAAAKWLSIVRATEKLCWRNAPEERLAALASGSCDRGRELVRRRAKLAHELVVHVS